MVDETKKKIDMVAGVTALLKYRKENPKASEEKMMGHVMRFINAGEFKDSQIQMVAAVSHATRLIERNPNLKDREVIRMIMDELASITPKEED